MLYSVTGAAAPSTKLYDSNGGAVHIRRITVAPGFQNKTRAEANMNLVRRRTLPVRPHRQADQSSAIPKSPQTGAMNERNTKKWRGLT